MARQSRFHGVPRKDETCFALRMQEIKKPLRSQRLSVGMNHTVMPYIGGAQKMTRWTRETRMAISSA